MTAPRGLHKYLSESRSIADAFGVYRAHVMPKTASPTQVIETRRAFYAAADWIFQRVIIACDDEQDGMRLLSEWRAELSEWQDKIKRGEV